MANQKPTDELWQQFERWCATFGETGLPASPRRLAQYVVFLRGLGDDRVTIGAALDAVRDRHRQSGYPDPTQAREVRSAVEQPENPQQGAL